MKTVLKKISEEDQKIAISSVSDLKNTSFRDAKAEEGSVSIQIQETGECITVPKKALSLMFSIIDTMADGKSVTLLSSDSEISTQQAADILNVSRPHVIKLLEKGDIPFKKVGSHRRILLKDLTEYHNKLQQIREQNLNFLAKQAQTLNLGYE